MPDLDGCVDCDGTCSSLDTIGCKLISHEEIEQQFDKTLRDLSRSTRYTGFMINLRQHYPITYKIVTALGF